MFSILYWVLFPWVQCSQRCQHPHVSWQFQWTKVASDMHTSAIWLWLCIHIRRMYRRGNWGNILLSPPMVCHPKATLFRLPFKPSAKSMTDRIGHINDQVATHGQTKLLASALACKMLIRLLALLLARCLCIHVVNKTRITTLLISGNPPFFAFSCSPTVATNRTFAAACHRPH